MHIRIVSPSSVIDPKYIDGAQQVLQSWGHEVSIAPHAKGRYGGAAGTTEERLQDLNDAFADPSVDMILCSRGGYGLAQIIDQVRVNPHKLLAGFSDITCLHCLCGKEGIPSLHSIMAKHIATLPADSEPIKALRAVLSGEDIRYTLPLSPYSREGEAAGILRGGNLSVFYGLQRTPFQVIDKDSILFIEDIDEPQYHIDRMLQNLRLSGVMKNIKGLIVGQFSDCADDVERMSCTLRETISRASADYAYPVLTDFPAGHVELNLPVFMNTPCHIKVEADKALFTQTNPLNSLITPP
ncbi:MAG: LD-carboxypeptidase [Paludibacteraceae bacterium]|nr:LD-carboxypeptidase [Paludibacteraceae bacterium]